MKFIYLSILVVPFILFTSCEDDKGCSEEPTPKYGNSYDDVSVYEDDCYISKTYTYYCYNGKYRAVQHTRRNCCGSWEKDEVTMDCLLQSHQDDLGKMNEDERQEFYRNLELEKDYPTPTIIR